MSNVQQIISEMQLVVCSTASEFHENSFTSFYSRKFRRQTDKSQSQNLEQFCNRRFTLQKSQIGYSCVYMDRWQLQTRNYRFVIQNKLHR